MYVCVAAQIFFVCVSSYPLLLTLFVTSVKSQQVYKPLKIIGFCPYRMHISQVVRLVRVGLRQHVGPREAGAQEYLKAETDYFKRCIDLL